MARKIKETNHFICLAVNTDKCPVGFLGQPICSGCIHNNNCTDCGRKGTSFCMHCDAPLLRAAKAVQDIGE